MNNPVDFLSHLCGGELCPESFSLA
jgi:hypothetical protein